MTIKEAAIKANGRSRACKRCQPKLCTPEISKMCFNAFCEGFIKGYKYRSNKLKKIKIRRDESNEECNNKK